ncbi:MAG: chemotaxis protein CheZ [bacterium]|jgi:chemotaxis protein CheZ
MNLLGAYLKYTLGLLKGEKITFLIPENPDDEFFRFNPGYVDLSKDIQSVEGELSEVEDKVFYLTKFLTITNKEKIRKLLRAISSFFKSIIRKDQLDIQSHMNHIHHLTASKDSHFLINDIGKITREIYNGLQDFTSELPIDGLGEIEADKDEMPDTIGKLNMVISRLEDSANATLDEVEELLDRNSAEQASTNKIQEKVLLIEQELARIQEENPEIKEKILPVLQDIKGDLHNHITERVDTLKTEESMYLKIMENQSFQDLSGQTLKKIIDFIERLEFNLLSLLNKYSGLGDMQQGNAKTKADKPVEEKEVDHHNPTMHGPQDYREASTTTQNDVDELLSQFGF